MFALIQSASVHTRAARFKLAQEKHQSICGFFIQVLFGFENPGASVHIRRIQNQVEIDGSTSKMGPVKIGGKPPEEPVALRENTKFG